MPSLWINALPSLLHTAPMRLALLVAASAWTAATCHAATRHTAESKPGHMLRFTPRLSSIALAASGIAVWGANGLEQPMLAAHVAAMSIAFMLGWEVGGMLERFIKQWL